MADQLVQKYQSSRAIDDVSGIGRWHSDPQNAPAGSVCSVFVHNGWYESSFELPWRYSCGSECEEGALPAGRRSFDSLAI